MIGPSVFSFAPAATAVRVVLAAILLGLLTVSTAFAGDPPSIRHTLFMRGQVVDIRNGSLVVCIGREDGVMVGQEFDVVRHRRVGVSPKGTARFQRKIVGKVRIDSIVDEHYAEASILSGKVKDHDSIELSTSHYP